MSELGDLALNPQPLTELLGHPVVLSLVRVQKQEGKLLGVGSLTLFTRLCPEGPAQWWWLTVSSSNSTPIITVNNKIFLHIVLLNW